jgi:hypothetical protein
MQEIHPPKSSSLRAHRRQFVWQILLPVLLAALVGLAAGGLTIALSLSDSTRTRVWADISIVWLILPLLLFALVFFALLVFLIYGLGQLLRIVPDYTAKAQSLTATLAALVRKFADGAARPILWVRQAVAAFKSIFDKTSGG